ncbi:MAG: N-acetyltransferase [Ilumatobacteraceae bacterium]
MIPDDFAVPQGLAADGFRLVPLGPQHNVADHSAWTSSIQHIRATPGFQGDWPPPEGMTLEQNLDDLRRHAEDFAARRGFTYTVLEAETDDVIGCVYIYPSRLDGYDARVRSWVGADRAALDAPLAAALSEWLATAWPFDAVEEHPRR